MLSFSRMTKDEDIICLAERMVWRFWLSRKCYVTALMSHMQVYNSVDPIRFCVYCRAVYVGQARCPNCGASEFRLASLWDQDLLIGRQYAIEINTTLVIERQADFYMEAEMEPYVARGPGKL